LRAGGYRPNVEFQVFSRTRDALDIQFTSGLSSLWLVASDDVALYRIL
jgi:hypothetical protein